MTARGVAPRQPLYQQVEARLREAIATGRHPVGSLLPTEAELCAALKVSRHTVREALRRLVEAGLLERRQGAGSIVIAREPARVEVQSIRSIDALMQYAANTRLEVLRHGMVPLTAEQAALALDEPGTRWLRVEAIRRAAGGQAIAQMELLVHPRFAGIAEELPDRGAIWRRIEQRFGVEVAEIVQDISAGLLPAAAASALNRRPRDVGMLFMRRFLDAAGDTLLVARSWHAADRFTYRMRLRRHED